MEKRCDFCGYSPDLALTPEEMSEEEKIAALQMFGGPDHEGGPLRTPEQCYELFLHHRLGSSADWLPEEGPITTQFGPKWISHPERQLEPWPRDNYGILWWPGREYGYPDPTLRPTHKYERVYKWVRDKFKNLIKGLKEALSSA